jgi:hypothetical protein
MKAIITQAPVAASIVILLSVPLPVAWADAIVKDTEMPITVTNQCTGTTVNGTASIHTVVQQSKGGRTLIKIDAQGSGEDEYGVEYQIFAHEDFATQDPLPADAVIEVQFISPQQDAPSISTDAGIQITDQGDVAKLELFEAECRGNDEETSNASEQAPTTPSQDGTGPSSHGSSPPDPTLYLPGGSAEQQE